jgi:hypothetical protein
VVHVASLLSGLLLTDTAQNVSIVESRMSGTARIRRRTA